MKINANRDILVKAINIAESVISARNINTALSNCLFKIGRDEIEVIATDNEVAIRTRLEAVSDSEGAFTANGKKLSSILKELPNDEVILSVNNTYGVDIRSKSKDVKGHYNLIGISAEDYPEVPVFHEDNSHEIDQAVLKEMIRKVMYAASTDTIKPVFNGIYMVSDIKGTLSLVATDSRRLSLINRSLENAIDMEGGVILPLKTVSEIYRQLGSSGRCRFSLDDRQFFIRIDSTEIISRVVDGHFPNYRQVIPLENNIEAVIETRKFIDSVKRAMIFTREPVNKVVLTFKKNSLVIEANTPELGQAEEELEIESTSDETLSLGINAGFLLECLKEIDSFSIKCGLTGQMSPVTLKPEDDSNYVSVIMPIQIRSSQGE